MKLTFLGAAGTVTGSSYLLETGRSRILIDFGLFQGGDREESLNQLPKQLDPSRLDAVLVTHGHLDHTGRLPLLPKNGYKGKLHCTPATRDLTGLILRDSAKIQVSDLLRTNRHRERQDLPPLEALYTLIDVEALMPLFHTVEYKTTFRVTEDITACFAEAGHMLGSASILLTIEEDGRKKTLVFSGDLGPKGMALVRDFVPFEKADVVVMESTYGDRDHRPLADTLEEFRGLVERTVTQGCKMLVPAFAIGRSQQMIYHLEEIFSEGKLKPFPIYLDSPMAIAATNIYRKFPDLFDEETRALVRKTNMTRDIPYLHTVESGAESMELNHAKGPCLVMAGSGMCNAGRILHHFRHNLWKKDTLVAIVGFQAQGTLGRLLVDGAKEVRVFGERIAVKAEVHTLNGFSAHAGQSDLLDWFSHLAPSKPRVFLTHGETKGRSTLAGKILERHQLSAECPELGDVITL